MNLKNSQCSSEKSDEDTFINMSDEMLDEKFRQLVTKEYNITGNSQLTNMMALDRQKKIQMILQSEKQPTKPNQVQWNILYNYLRAQVITVCGWLNCFKTRPNPHYPY